MQTMTNTDRFNMGISLKETGRELVRYDAWLVMHPDYTDAEFAMELNTSKAFFAWEIESVMSCVDFMDLADE